MVVLVGWAFFLDSSSSSCGLGVGDIDFASRRFCFILFNRVEEHGPW